MDCITEAEVGNEARTNVGGQRTIVFNLRQLLITAQQDTNWLTEKALGSLFGNNSTSGRVQIEQRRQRIIATLETATKFIQGQHEEIGRRSVLLDQLDRELKAAIVGLHDFLEGLSTLPMPPETKAVVDGQLTTIKTLLVRDGNTQQG